MMVQELLARATHSLKVSIAGMISKSIVRSAYNAEKSSKPLLKIEAFADEAIEDVDYFQHYGFASSCPEDSEAIVIFIGGDRSHPAVIATGNNKHRPVLGSDEVAIYHRNGSIIRINNNGITISSKDKEGKALPVTVNCSQLEVSGDLKVKGNISFGSANTNLEDFKTKYNTHIHEAGKPPPQENFKV